MMISDNIYRSKGDPTTSNSGNNVLKCFLESDFLAG